MINNRLYWWLQHTRTLNNSQAGFRKAIRTEDHLFRFMQDKVEGFEDGKHTTAVFIDLQQAYDRVWIPLFKDEENRHPRKNLQLDKSFPQ